MSTMTMRELLASVEAEEAQAIAQRDQATTAVKAVLERAKAEGRTALTDDEKRGLDEQLAARDRVDGSLTEVRTRLASLRSIADAEEKVDAQMQQRDPNAERVAEAPKPYDGVARVSRGERTYRPDTDKRGAQFLRDVTAQFLFNDVHANQRLSRHMEEEVVERGDLIKGRQERAVGTGAFAGLTVPQYLTDLYAPSIKAGRPFADICNHHDLPEQGMTVNISRITTGSGVAVQATENTAVQNTDMDDTLLTENVQTVAGQQTISRQAIDRGTGVEAIVVDDLFRQYGVAVDSLLLNQATTGLAAFATANAYTDASPTGLELYPKILGAAAGVEATLLGWAAVDVAVMHSRRWFWLQSQMTTSWPLIGQQGIGGQQIGVNNGKDYGTGFRGVLPNGIAVVVDNNISTAAGAGTEDEIYLVASQECHLWENPDAPIFIRAEQPAVQSLGVVLVAYSYLAYSFRRFGAGAVQKIAGTGLIAPVFA
jgi:HK97 family phage major capsid protein